LRSFDGMFMNLASQMGGIDPLLNSFFGFMRRAARPPRCQPHAALPRSARATHAPRASPCSPSRRKTDFFHGGATPEAARESVMAAFNKNKVPP